MSKTQSYHLESVGFRHSWNSTWFLQRFQAIKSRTCTIFSIKPFWTLQKGLLTLKKEEVQPFLSVSTRCQIHDVQLDVLVNQHNNRWQANNALLFEWQASICHMTVFEINQLVDAPLSCSHFDEVVSKSIKNLVCKYPKILKHKQQLWF